MMLVVCLFMVNFASAITWDNVAYYKLDETSGSVLDATGVNDGSNINSTTTDVSGIINTAYDFTTTDQTRIEVPDDTSLNFTDTFTINFWADFDSITSGGIIHKGSLSGTQGSYAIIIESGIIKVRLNNIDITANANDTIGANGWNMITATYDKNAGNIIIYLNGTQSGTTAYSTVITPEAGTLNIGTYYSNQQTMDGTLDEIGLWDRTLTPGEITELYNSGNGLAYGGSGTDPTVTLEVLGNATTISDIGTDFIVSGNDISRNNWEWTNITYVVWNTSNVHNTTFVELVDNSTFNNTLEIDYFSLATYQWNAYACWKNSTFSNCSWGASNNTFNVVPTSTVAESYINTTIEGSTDLFSINLSVISGLRMSTITFTYNNTKYESSFTEYATNIYYASISQDIPQVSANTNITFYWTATLESGFAHNSTPHNQTVQNLTLDDCSTGTYVLFNFTLLDEATQGLLVGATDNTSIKIDMFFTNIKTMIRTINFNKHYNQVNDHRICSNIDLGNSKFRVDGVVEYDSDPRFLEFYNIQNYTLTNSTDYQNISLYNLKTSEGQEFKITYKGKDFVPVTDLIVQIQRKYIDEGVFKTIEIPMSGTNGYTIAHLVPNDVVYNLIFLKEGKVLDSFTDVIANCQNPSITECEINLNSLITGENLQYLVTDSEFSSSLSFNPTTRVITSTFIITSGIPGVVTLNATLIDNFGNQSICSDSLNSAGGTLTCTVPASFGNSTIYATLSYNGEIKNFGYIQEKDDPKNRYGGVLIMGAIILLLFMFGIGVSDNPMITGVFLIIGAVLLVALNLVYSTSWFGAGATILWFVIAVVIVIVKGGKR